MYRKIISPVNEILHRTLVAKKSVPKSFDELHVSLFFWSKKKHKVVFKRYNSGGIFTPAPALYKLPLFWPVSDVLQYQTASLT